MKYVLETDRAQPVGRRRDGWDRVEEGEPAPGYALADPAVQTVYVKAGATKTVVFVWGAASMTWPLPLASSETT